MIQQLYTPGPVPVPPEIRNAGSVLHHRSDAFLDLSQRLWSNLKKVFRTESPVAVLSGSGMCGIESVVASTVRHGDAVVVLNHGRFGQRLVQINTIYGATVHNLEVEWGQTITPGMVEHYLSTLSNITAVWCVHSETSTGVLLDLESIAHVIRKYFPSALILVDGVLGVGIEKLEVDLWGIDAVVTGIQKGLRCPPGIACVSVSQRAHEHMKMVPQATYTMHLPTVLADLDKGLFTWTPPVTLVGMLEASTLDFVGRGLPAVWEHHKELAGYVRRRGKDIGLQSFGDGTAHGVVVFSHAQAIEIVQTLAKDYNFIVAFGQDHLAPTTFRVGTCGSYTQAAMDELFDAIKTVVNDL